MRPYAALIALVAVCPVRAEDARPPSATPSQRPVLTAEAPLRLPRREVFRLFPELGPEERAISLTGVPEDRRLLHQAGDPDSLFTLGEPTPEGEVHLKAAIEVNEIFLKAIPPNPLVAPGDTRPRAPGSFLPVDTSGRPYQLRLGARLVW